MSKIVPIITALPFYALPNNWLGPNSTIQDPFYFQKEQCLRDCHFGTITDREHLPSFIIRVDKDTINYSSIISWNYQCADGLSMNPIVPAYRWEVIGFATQAELLGPITAAGPAINDAYYVDLGTPFDIEIFVWNGSAFLGSGQVTPLENDLMNVTGEGLVYAWVPKDNGDNNPARNGFWEKTNNGMQLCDIGDYTYVIYNGFKVESNGSPMDCGLKQIRFSFPNIYNAIDSPFWLSELVDIRDFNPINNEYHKLTIGNSCNLGNIPYTDIRYNQIYYFDETTLVGEPTYKTEDAREEDGLGDETLIFSRLSKVHTLDTLDTPEYIVDFLMFATQHDTIGITFPYEFSNMVSNQNSANIYSGNRELDSDSFTVSSDWIETGCFSQVTLVFSLIDDIVKTACCQELDKIACVECDESIILVACYNEQLQIESGPPSIGDKILIKPVGDPDCDVCDDPPACELVYSWYGHPNEIATWTISGWSYEVPYQDRCIKVLINDQGDTVNKFYVDGFGWVIVGSNTAVIGQYDINITGHIFENTSGYLYYRRSVDYQWILWGIFYKSTLAAGVLINPPLAPCTEYDVKILSISNNCDYGDGPISEYTTLSDPSC
jgi:hypothetical protein